MWPTRQRFWESLWGSKEDEHALQSREVHFGVEGGKFLGFVGDLTSTRDEDNSLYISGCKPHLMSQFYGVELGLKFTS